MIWWIAGIWVEYNDESEYLIHLGFNFQINFSEKERKESYLLKKSYFQQRKNIFSRRKNKTSHSRKEKEIHPQGRKTTTSRRENILFRENNLTSEQETLYRKGINFTSKIK